MEYVAGVTEYRVWRQYTLITHIDFTHRQYTLTVHSTIHTQCTQIIQTLQTDYTHTQCIHRQYIKTIHRENTH